jgi:hypothetical protein
MAQTERTRAGHWALTTVRAGGVAAGLLGGYWGVTGIRTGHFTSPVRMTGVLFLTSACYALSFFGAQPADEVLWERNSRRFARKVSLATTVVLGVVWLAAVVVMLRAR